MTTPSNTDLCANCGHPFHAGKCVDTFGDVFCTCTQFKPQQSKGGEQPCRTISRPNCNAPEVTNGADDLGKPVNIEKVSELAKQCGKGLFVCSKCGNDFSNGPCDCNTPKPTEQQEVGGKVYEPHRDYKALYESVQQDLHEQELKNTALRTQNAELAASCALKDETLKEAKAVTNSGYLARFNAESISVTNTHVNLHEKIDAALSPTTASDYVKWVEGMENVLLPLRNRLSAHDGCSRFQIGDLSLLEQADKALSQKPK